MATWLESGREKRNLGMAGLTAVLQVKSLVKETFEVILPFDPGLRREGSRVGVRKCRS